MTDETIVGQYARVVIEGGTGPLRKGLTLACRLVGLSMERGIQRGSMIRGEVVSNDVDGPLPTELLRGSLIISPEDPEISEGQILDGSSFRAKLDFLAQDGEVVAVGEGALIRVSEEIPYERPCPSCMGWKMCEDCAGMGGESTAVCAYCEGSGVCTRCRGTGSVKEPD